MRAKHSQTGGAYAFTMVVTLLLFMIITVTLAVTAQSRRVTANYVHYDSLYDMAVAGNEQTLRLLNETLSARRGEIDASIRSAIVETDMTQQVVYRNGTFYLAFPENGYYAALYKTRAKAVIAEKLAETYRLSGGKYKTNSVITVSLSTDTTGLSGDESTPLLADSYHIETAVTINADSYTLSSSTYKVVNGVSGYPTVVEAELVWPDTAHTEIWVPAYQWKADSEPFNRCLYASGEINTADANFTLPEYLMQAENGETPFAAVVDIALWEALQARPAASLCFTTGPGLDVSALYAGDTPAPVAVLHQGGPLRMFASVPEKSRFAGILVCLSALEVQGVEIAGTVLVDGDIRIIGAVTLHSTPDRVFQLPLPEGVREIFFDFLRLTHFGAGGTDIAHMLGRLSFDMAGKNGIAFDLQINNFDADLLTMVKSKKIAN